MPIGKTEKRCGNGIRLLARYMNDQDAKGVGDKALGLTTVSHGGCGVIATYNTLIDLGEPRAFEDVLRTYNRGLGIRLFFWGLAGIRPKRVVNYFKKLGYTVITSRNLGEVDEFSAVADGSILYYRWDSKRWIPPYFAHFVSYHREKEGYVALNVGNRSVFFRSPSQFAEKEKASSVMGIFVFKND